MTKFLPLIVLSFLFLSCKQNLTEQATATGAMAIDSPRVKTITAVLNYIKNNEPDQAVGLFKDNRYKASQQQYAIQKFRDYIPLAKNAIDHYGIPPVSSWKIKFDTCFYPYGSVSEVKAPALAIYEWVYLPLHAKPDSTGIPSYLLFSFPISDPNESPAFIVACGFCNNENEKDPNSFSGRADTFIKKVNGVYTDPQRMNTCRQILNEIHVGQSDIASQFISNIEYQYPNIEDFGPRGFTNNGNDKATLLYIQACLKVGGAAPENQWKIKLDTVFYKANTTEFVIPYIMISEFVDVPLNPNPGSANSSAFLRFIFDRTDPNAPPTIVNRITLPSSTLLNDTRTRFVCDVIN